VQNMTTVHHVQQLKFFCSQLLPLFRLLQSLCLYSASH
jgi:hypothetical protein